MKGLTRAAGLGWGERLGSAPKSRPRTAAGRMTAGMAGARGRHLCQERGPETYGNWELFSDPESRPRFQTIILFSSVKRKLFLPLCRSVPPLHEVLHGRTSDVWPGA